ncbi:Apoptotic chromatin condensation inducer in the nucleus [Eumeta japonica]|uniref:Apoptotic chromatin condensation inducer in the nucleus n=1 Tax=Eumeta variegata TaxID=151549 RepID=A0A4C1SM64_EUMVA|nr:Apoptotic chromatin condensation inducer in the nucleus [Eumeta japonica]
MINAIESTKEESSKFGQETSKENLLVGSGWSRERHEDDKKENLEREKVNRDVDRRRERSRDRSLDRSRDRSRDRNMSRNRENERMDRERDRRQRRERDIRSHSLTPVRKQKKKEDPPLRLLDDLFRKTKATPCIYWLPLNPEQIRRAEATSEAKGIEREKDRERERNRNSDRERDRDHRRSNRSSDRRRSRSRDRRRY